MPDYINNRHYNINNKYNYYNNKFQNDIVKNRLISLGSGCPNCIYNNDNEDVALDEKNMDESKKDSTTENNHQHLYNLNDQSTIFKLGNEFTITSEQIRLEAIRHQILTKLGLKSPPILSNMLPKQMVMDTLRRAESVNKASTEDDPISLQLKDKNLPTKDESKSSTTIFQDKDPKIS